MRLLMAAKQHLIGEKVEFHLEGLYKSEMMGFDKHREAVMVATDRQVFVYCQKLIGFETESISLSTINSLEVSKGITGYKVKIMSVNNNVELIYIKSHKAQEVESFVEYVRRNRGPANQNVPASVPGGISIADELLKMKQLLDMGVLTQSEFDKKKKELLA
jgi:hypothetical protein